MVSWCFLGDNFVSRLVSRVILCTIKTALWWKPTFGLDKELLTLATCTAGERYDVRAGDFDHILGVVSFGTEAVWECNRRSLDPV